MPYNDNTPFQLYRYPLIASQPGQVGNISGSVSIFLHQRLFFAAAAAKVLTNGYFVSPQLTLG